ncbi:hypothetical protein D477_012238 [Arthrobacter crystallopoietes BAB-32]|uniref:Uncharacterized protein n=1 Tax=Arthrobacter crystallopoietes BAB-32 TaxID=1246476 RepID=N1UY10_9MICC|nr:hypothetical protein [Arthrobacter crystallopoietes]EMY33945.1 hypothetical protein D477_012238 [Arthrobacter crystallopoietes BAB-32]
MEPLIFIMIALVVAGIVWVLLAARADHRADKHVSRSRSGSGWSAPGAYGAGTIGGTGFYSDSSTGDSGGGGDC